MPFILPGPNGMRLGMHIGGACPGNIPGIGPRCAMLPCINEACGPWKPGKPIDGIPPNGA